MGMWKHYSSYDAYIGTTGNSRCTNCTFGVCRNQGCYRTCATTTTIQESLSGCDTAMYLFRINVSSVNGIPHGNLLSGCTRRYSNHVRFTDAIDAIYTINFHDFCWEIHCSDLKIQVSFIYWICIGCHGYWLAKFIGCQHQLGTWVIIMPSETKQCS